MFFGSLFYTSRPHTMMAHTMMVVEGCVRGNDFTCTQCPIYCYPKNITHILTRIDESNYVDSETGETIVTYTHGDRLMIAINGHCHTPGCVEKARYGLANTETGMWEKLNAAIIKAF